MSTLTDPLETQICIFCWKSGSKDNAENLISESEGEKREGKDPQQIFERFLAVLGKYVGGGAQFGKDGLLEGIVGACEKCGGILADFCNLYSEMVRVKLEMDWRLEKLMGRMERGGRMQSRMWTVKEALEKRVVEGSGGGDGILQNIRAMRSDIMGKCIDKLSKSRPKVILEEPGTLTPFASPSSPIIKVGNDDHGNESSSSSSQPEADIEDDGFNFDNDFIMGAAGDDDYQEETEAYPPEEKFCPPGDIPTESGSPEMTGEESSSKKDNPSSSYFPCPACPAVFTFQSNRSRHVTSKHPGLSRSCRARKRATKSYQEEDSNSDEDNDESDEEYIPKKPTTSSPGNSSKKDFECVFCSKTFTWKWRNNMIRHLRTAHSKSLEDAKLIFQTQIDVDGNKDNNDKDDDKTSPAVVQPEEADKMLSSFTCTECSATFKHQGFLRAHLRRIHGTSHKKESDSGNPPEKCEDPPLMAYQAVVGTGEAAGVPGNESSRPFKCSKCPATFKYAFRFKHHVKTYHEPGGELGYKRSKIRNRKFRCRYCQRGFAFRQNLSRHIKSHKRSGQQGQSIKLEVEGEEAMEEGTTTANSYRYACKLCPKRYTLRQNLYRHRKTAHRPQEEEDPSSSDTDPEDKQGDDDNLIYRPLTHYLFRCPNCTTKTFTIKGNVIKHLRFVHSMSLHDANVTFNSQVDNLKFLKDESECAQPKNLTCPYCTVKFSTEIARERHLIRFHSSTPSASSIASKKAFPCPLCSRAYRFRGMLDNHLKVHHGGPGTENRKSKVTKKTPPPKFGVDERKTCKTCGKRFTFYKNLRAHMRQVHNYNDEDPELPVPCQVPECRKRFGSQEDLEWHMKFVRHDKEKGEPVDCPECGRSCVGAEGLRVHMRSHRLEEFMCEQCGKEFRTKKQLQVHNEFHKKPEEWSFMCTECGRKFATDFILKRHMKVHGGKERPHVCEVCGRGFAERQHLRYHLNAVHKDHQAAQSTDHRDRDGLV